MNTNATLYQQPDTDAVEAFEARLASALSEAGMLMMISIGHRLALFSTLANGATLTSEALAMLKDIHRSLARVASFRQEIVA